MDRRAWCGMLACCVLVAHTAALGHAHGVGTPPGHDLRPHVHLAADAHSHAPSHPPHAHAGHSHAGHGAHSHHHGPAADPVPPATTAPEAREDETPAGTGWRSRGNGHDDDALYLAVAAATTDLGRKAFATGFDGDFQPDGFPSVDGRRPAADGGCGSHRFRRPPRDGCAQLARYLLNHAFRC